jgi:HD-GYP domain-containing protein (c-di-GMP phosphodiesterase class II)
MLNIQLADILIAFSSVIDMMSPQKSDHNRRVAYIAYSISSEMGLLEKDKSQILIAGLLHDCGAICEDKKSRVLQFDSGGTTAERHEHGIRGWNLLKRIEELKPAAEIIKFHLICWNERNSTLINNSAVPIGSYIIHLADRISILIDRKDEILEQSHRIEETVRNNSGTMFMPDAVDAFIRLSSKEYFWFDIVSPYIEQALQKYLHPIKIMLNADKFLALAGISNKIICYRSRFAAAHSIGVAVCARVLSSKMHFSKAEVQMMYIAGLLHDMGKLAIPVHILEKNGPLSKEEYNIVKMHPYYTRRILEVIPQTEALNDWVSYHHEHLDGSGYPFGIKDRDLNMGSRIMAVSDVFAALTEVRPYRPSMDAGKACSIVEDMVKSRHLDGDVAAILKLNLDEICQLKQDAQNSASASFTNFTSKSDVIAHKTDTVV